jgi:L-alanine-DL-glutamate epimerase-like enolase superfamily enzyme
MTATAVRGLDAPLQELEVAAFTVPTDAPEGDGTLSWEATTIVVVHALAAGQWGLGYSYADVSTAKLIESRLAGVVEGRDAMSPPSAWAAMVDSIRNLGRPGIASMAIAAVDTAIWDLKARLLGLPLSMLIGAVRDEVPIYGSGGFTSYSKSQLTGQLERWVADGIRRVKIKIGSEPELDPARARLARETIGPNVELFVDANGAYSRKQALALAERFDADAGISWFEEPVSSDDLAGLRLLRDRAPGGVAIAAGEYGYDLPYFRRMLEAGAVDVLQADVTRCAGITELLRVGALCSSHQLPLSLHCGPAIHLHPALGLQQLVHLEYFHDHARIEQLLFDGSSAPRGGALHPQLDRPGNGLELKRAEAERYAA